MSRLALTVLIRRPVADVWALIVDMDRYSVAWGEHYTVTSAGPLGLGSTAQDDDGQTVRVVEFEPMRVFSVESGTTSNWALRRFRLGHILEPTLEGTSFTTWFEPELKGWGRVLRPVLVRFFIRAARKPVYGVKRYLEAGRTDRWSEGAGRPE